MKISFDPARLIQGGLVAVQQIGQQVQKAEEDGKVDKKEVAVMAFSILGTILSVLAMSMKVNDQPIYGGDDMETGP